MGRQQGDAGCWRDNRYSPRQLASAAKATLHGRRRELEFASHLADRQALEVAQHDHVAVRLGQRLDRGDGVETEVVVSPAREEALCNGVVPEILAQRRACQAVTLSSYDPKQPSRMM
jgi:hypothetical protein